MTTVGDLPEVLPDTVLHLRQGEWSGGPDEFAGCMTVMRVHTDGAEASATRVWVSGHLPECGWSSVEPHPPCCEVRVRASAILRCIREASR